MKRRLFTIKPSWRKVISDLWSNKSRTGLVVASIAVGVFAVGMIAGTFVIIPEDMNASYSGANPANIAILTAPFDTDLLTSIRRVEGVGDAQGIRQVNVRLKTGPDSWSGFDLTAVSDFSSNRINAQQLIAGKREPAKEEVILEKKTAEKNNLGVGDVLTVELGDGTIRELPIVGITQDVTSGAGGMFNRTRGYVHYDTLEWLHVPAYYNQLLVTVSEHTNDKEYIQRVAAEVSDKLKKSGRETYTTNQYLKDTHPMESVLQALLRILMVLGVLIVFLSGSLISNTLQALLNQHMPQIGIMKLVGARSSQIRRLYLALILAFGLMALVIAVPLGSLGAYGLSAFAAGLIGFPLSGFRVIPMAVAIQVAIGLLVPLLAGYPAVLSGVRVTVQKAITAGGLNQNLKMGKSMIDRLLARLRGLSRPALVSIRNTFRRKGRLVLTLFTLTLGGAIFISVFNVQVSLNQKIERITKYFGADVNLDLARTYPILQIETALQDIPGVQRVEAWVMTQADVLGENNEALKVLTVLAPPAGSTLVQPILMQGRWLQPGDSGMITVNEAFLRQFPNTQLGDTLRLKIGGRKSEWQVVGVFQFTGKDDLIAYTTYDSLSKEMNASGRTSTYRIVGGDHSLAGQKQLSAVVDAAFREKGFKVKNVEAGGTFTSTMTEYIAILTAFLVVMAMLTAAVGSIGMAGTLSMNVMERTREIGVLRAIGAYNGVILRLVLQEGLIIGLISFGLGSLLSFPISKLLSEVISNAIFNTPGEFVLTSQGFLIWLGVVILLSALASLIPARAASRMTIREVLAYE